MLDRLGIAKEQLRQFKMMLHDYVKKAAKNDVSRVEYEQMVDFMLDKIKEAMNRIEELESDNF